MTGIKVAGIFALAMAGFLCEVLTLEILRLAPVVVETAGHVNRTTANAELASGQLAEATLDIRAVTKQLADKDSGLTPMLGSAVMSLSSAASSLDGAAGHLNSLLANANDAVQDARTQAPLLLAAAKPTLEKVDAAVTSAKSVAAQVSDAAPLFLDCEYNQDCAFNRFQGTSKAIEQMAQAGAKAAPELTASAEKIAGSAESMSNSGAQIVKNVEREVDAATKPKKWWEKILGPAYTIGRLVAAFL